MRLAHVWTSICKDRIARFQNDYLPYLTEALSYRHRSCVERMSAEIDENLIRNELTPAERAKHTARRIELVKAIEPVSQVVTALSKNAKRGADKPTGPDVGSTRLIAELTGRIRPA